MNALPASDLHHIVYHAPAMWEQLRGARLLITGGTGFFGRWLLESFLFANEQLGLEAHALILTRDRQRFAAKAPHLANAACFEFLEGDVRNFTLSDCRLTHVIHGATTSGAAVAPREMFDTIVEGTRQVLDAAVAAGAGKFLLISSGAVYGRQPPEMSAVREDYRGAPDAGEPASAYAEGKRAAELLCAIARSQHGLETTTARCFAFVGPHLPLDAHFAIGNFIANALAGQPLRIRGDGSPVRSYLYAADLALWLWTLLLRGAAGRAYNVGSDQPLSIAQTARAVVDAAGTHLPVEIALTPNPAVPAERYVPATTRARDELGLQVLVPLAEALRRTLAWNLSGAAACPGPLDTARAAIH